MATLTRMEKDFIERVKPLLRGYLAMCKTEGIEPGGGSYVISLQDKIYHGVPFGVARWIHGEENAIGTMITEEGLREAQDNPDRWLPQKHNHALWDVPGGYQQIWR